MARPSVQPSILVVDDETELLEILTFLLDLEFGLHVHTAGSGQEAVGILKDNPNFLAVVSDFRMRDGNGYSVFQYLLNNNMKIPFVLCSSESLDSHPEFLKGDFFMGLIQKPDFKEPLFRFVEALLESLGLRSKTPDSLYCPIGIHMVKNVGKAATNLYLRLSDNNFVKVFQAGDSFDMKDLSHYLEKQVIFLYVLRSEASPWVKLFRQEIQTTVQKTDLTAHHLFEAAQTTAQLTQNALKCLGWNAEIIELAKLNTEIAIKSIERFPKISEWLDQLHPSKGGNALSTRSALICVLSCGLARLLPKPEPELFERLALASLVYDMGLTPTEALNLGIHHRQALDLSFQKFDEIKHFREHPNRAYVQLRSFVGFPLEVSTIVKQHHEQADGQGYPDGLNHDQIGKTSAIFILAQQLAEYFINSGTVKNIHTFFENHSKTFTQGELRKIFVLFEHQVLKGRQQD